VSPNAVEPAAPNPLGVNTWVWVSPLTDSRLATIAPRVKDMGFDVIELPIENPDDWDAGRAADVLDELGLGATTCAVMPSSRDLVIEDQDVVVATQAYLHACVRMAARVGASVVAGPIYAPVGRTWHLDPGDRRQTIGRLVEALKPAADDAAKHGVVLAVEPLNRYETSLINTVEQALEVIEAVGSPGCGLLVDTFRMNIEEKDVGAAIRSAGPHLAHIQVCGNDRGAPGNDHIDWPAVAEAVRDVGYVGPISIESFTAENQTIATAASIWRPLERSQDAIAVDGLAHLRRVFSEATRTTDSASARGDSGHT
jgi:D-psicose/D-tagatose/L-ribulose 3-epimerase